MSGYGRWKKNVWLIERDNCERYGGKFFFRIVSLIDKAFVSINGTLVSSLVSAHFVGSMNFISMSTLLKFYLTLKLVLEASP